MQIWDTAGNEKYRSITNLYYHDADVAILVFDVSNSISFEDLDYWLTELSEKVDKENMLLFFSWK